MRKLDCLETHCPIPIIKTAELIKELEVGSNFTLLSDDPATWPDLQAWARMKSHRVERVFEQEFLITKLAD